MNSKDDTDTSFVLHLYSLHQSLKISLSSSFFAYNHLVCVLAKLFQSCPTPCDPRDGSPPGSSVHGNLQAIILEWGTIPFSSPKAYSPLRTIPGSSCLKKGLPYPVDLKITQTGRTMMRFCFVGVVVSKF